ncbi:hypothetical protein JCM8202v2_003459 [Rhodotorula sphaerocarpa]
MATYDSTPLLLVRSTATVGLGVATGLMLSYPLFSWPAMYAPDAQMDCKARLNLFWELYCRGKDALIKLLPLSAGLLAYASYATETAASYLPATFVARHRKASPGAILGTAAALTLSNVLWTVVMIMPVNTKLKTIKDAKASGKATAEANTPDVEIDKMIRTRWMGLHYGRIALTATAFALSVAELGTA